jgi:serine/threonine protein kinase
MPKPPLKRIEELFNQTVALPLEQRSAALDAACGGDAELRAAVETLLRHHGEATDVLRDGPVAREAFAARKITVAEPLPPIPEYEVLRELGHGGMGVVYLARHLPLRRLVALKRLPTLPATDEQLARFRLEAEALARLQHPNIVPIYHIGEFEGHPYFTMEYIAGPSLAVLMDERPQDVTASARLLEVLARAVHAVHECGIIHRDLKPANVLFAFSSDPEGNSDALPSRSRLNEAVPKITDFGLAKDRTSPRHLTQAGVIMGTPCYMAPEQVRNRRGGVGPAADIYALGSILYQLLTGRPPFDAATPIEIIAQLLNREPLSPAQLRPRLPRDLVTICLKCLEKSPFLRYASAWELAEDLRRFQAGEPIHARAVGRPGRIYRWCLRKPLVAGLLALSTSLAVALVVLVAVYEVRLNAEQLASAQALAEAERRQIAQLNIAIGIKELDDGDAWLAVLRFAEALRLDEKNEDNAPLHHARIAAALSRCPRLLELASHDGRIVCVNQGLSGVHISAIDADHVVVVRDEPAGRTTATPLRFEDLPADAALTLDGNTLATIDQRGVAQLWDLQTGKCRAVPESTQATVAVALSDDARWLLTRNGAGVCQVRELATGKPTGPTLKPEPDVTCAALSADGRRLALVTRDGLRVWDVAAAAWLGNPLPQLGPIGPVRFSPDGRWLVACTGRAARVWDVGTGKAVTPPLRHGSLLVAAALAADGKQVVTVSRRGTICVWDVPAPREADAAEPPPDNGSVPPALRALAELHTCTRIDENQQAEDLDEDTIRAIWGQLHPAP